MDNSDTDEIERVFKKGPVAVNRREVGEIENECQLEWIKEKRKEGRKEKERKERVNITFGKGRR